MLRDRSRVLGELMATRKPLDWKELETLTDQERMVLGVRLGYQHTLSEAAEMTLGLRGAEVFRIGRERVRQIENEALQKLRRAGFVVCWEERPTYRFVHGRTTDGETCFEPGEQ